MHRNANPIVFGRVEQQEQDGLTHPVQIASIVADGKLSRTQANGKYVLHFAQGKHTITVKWLGLKSLTVREINLHRGDSVNIDFNLVSDTTKYVN